MNENKSGSLFLIAGFGITFLFFIYILFFQSRPHPDVPDLAAKANEATAAAAAPAEVPAAEPWVVTPEVLAKGKTVYQTYCTVCHGEKGLGDGPGGAALNPRARNFTSEAGWKNGASPFGILKTVKNGIPGGSMVAFNIPETDQWAVVHYVRELAGSKVAVAPTQEEIDAYKKGSK